eukprot:GHVU01082064.1.p2 GENE.GHVU01082064.1~~GHVU01082064.1.p2  ORF type:complete len:127 (+),score=15.45 GHVU01082064.1:232-612(+)
MNECSFVHANTRIPVLLCQYIDTRTGAPLPMHTRIPVPVLLSRQTTPAHESTFTDVPHLRRLPSSSSYSSVWAGVLLRRRCCSSSTAERNCASSPYAASGTVQHCSSGSTGGTGRQQQQRQHRGYR